MDTKETTLYTAILIASVVIGIIILFFVRSIVLQQKRVVNLQKENMLAAISSMEKERTRIAADLHDDLGPILSVVKFQIDNVETITVEEKAELQKASAYIDDLSTRLREISNNLMPNVLLRKGLVSAIEEFKNRVEQANHLSIHFTHANLPALSQEQNIHVYRIIQELVHNSLKHARASSLQIALQAKGQVLTILYKDNGIGFDYEKRLKESPGIGLRSLRNRAELIGGSLRVESIPMKGTAFLFTIPIKLNDYYASH